MSYLGALGDELDIFPSKKKKERGRKEKSDNKCWGNFHVTVNVLPLKPNLRQEKVFCEGPTLARTQYAALLGGQVCVTQGRR